MAVTGGLRPQGPPAGVRGAAAHTRAKRRVVEPGCACNRERACADPLLEALRIVKNSSALTTPGSLTSDL